MSKVIDFTSQTWGHAFHGLTPIDPKNPVDALRDKIYGTVRYSTSCHYQKVPHVGDKMRYRISAGIIDATIYQVEWCHDPRDMYHLKIKISNKDRKAVK